MKHPLKQTRIGEYMNPKTKREHVVDSLDNSARYEVHDQFADAKAKELDDKAIRDKYDATAPKYNPTFNDSTLVGSNASPPVMPTPAKKPGFKEKIASILKRFTGN